MLVEVYEGVAELLYGVSHALRINKDYQRWMMYFKPEWLPIFNDSPPLSDRDPQVTSPGSSQGGSSLLRGQDLDPAAAAAAPAAVAAAPAAAAAAAADFLGSLAVLRS